MSVLCAVIICLIMFSLFLHPGQIQEETASHVEVTPELDLEVVPESSGDWHNVFP